MRKGVLLIAVAAFLCAGVPAMAEKMTLAVVVKGLDNPFFNAVSKGCVQWNKENPKSDYECVTSGPESSVDSAGQIDIVEKLIASGVAGLAIAPSDPAAMAKAIRASGASMPIITIDTDFGVADRALRSTFLGTNNYQMGVLMAQLLMKYKPDGGTVCLQLGNVAADNINARAQGFRDAVTGVKDLQALKGEGGWTEVAGCPVFTNDDGAKGVQAMTDILAANPDLDE